MTIIPRNAWSEKDKGYVVTGFEVHVKPTEMLVISRALRRLAENEDANKIDRASAERMLEEYRRSLKT